jgi:hypothetical protein
METECSVVSSKGLRKSCIDYKTCHLSTLRQNDLLYVASDFIYEFSKRLPEISVSFVLVTGDSDYTIPFDLFPNQDTFHTFIENKKILKWFVQNCVYVHEKIILMPIGLDYHTFHEPPLEQEKTLLECSVVKSQILKIYSNCHFAMNTRYGKERRDAIQCIPSDLLVLEPSYLPRKQSWLNQKKYMFCLSPHGNGLDCHRTWEAIALGTIPIVKSSPLDSMYEHLPVLIVKEWKDVTETLLQNTVHQFESQIFQFEKIKLRYWLDRMRNPFRNLYVVGHSGLGDHLFMIGGIRFLTQFYDTIYLFCNEKYQHQIGTFYEKDKVKLLPIQFTNLQEEKQKLEDGLRQVSGDILVCGLWKSFIPKRLTHLHWKDYVPPPSKYTIDLGTITTVHYSFIEEFYKDMNLSLEHFYEWFHLESTPESIQLYEKIQDFYIVFIQQKCSDGRSLSIEHLLTKYLYKEDTLLICNDSNLYDGIQELEKKRELAEPFVKNNIVLYTKVIQECDEIHMIDSCFLGLVLPYSKTNRLRAKVIEITLR